VCSIEHFSDLLAIAFSVGAIFYYIDLREIAEKRRKAALMIHDAAQRTANLEIGRAILDKITSDMQTARKRGESWLTARTPPATAQQRNAMNAGLNKGLLSDFSKASVISLSYLTHAFAVLSTATSLGTLLFSAYYPDKRELDCKWMTVILVASYASIIWNLLFYFIYIPAVTSLIRRVVPADQSGKSVTINLTSDRSEEAKLSLLEAGKAKFPSLEAASISECASHVEFAVIRR
jgi:hypothetical protein